MTRTIREELRTETLLYTNPEWERDLPWLVQGMTPREAGNFASFGSQSAETLHKQWKRLRDVTGMRTTVLGRQVHAAKVLQHDALSPGLMLADDSDGQMTRSPGVLLAVSIADCVPVLVVDPNKRAVAALHAGWRGTAQQIVRNCLELMGNDVRVHLGPGICGECYEVGPEVHEALGLEVPVGNTPVDLRAVLAQQCRDLGVREEAITTSAWCTRCGDSPFYSHRAGHPERQVAVIGMQ